MGKKHCGKRRKCLLPAFSPFPTMFSKVVLSRGLCGKELKYKVRVLEGRYHCGKGENASYKHFLLFPQSLQRAFGLWGKGLILYHTIRVLKSLNENAFENSLGKRRKCSVPEFSPFVTMFLTLSKTAIKVWVAFDQWSVNYVLNLLWPKILLSGKKLTLNHTILTFMDPQGKEGGRA